ncbi:ArsR/SmtB family transcription factor [Devosia sp. RR2S18]|uniref:ArsR/SmtB family transcription factor n=1 Tax=Devosia rhizosphaerae TaxID=3049774 RepID=UPI002541D0A2|nr:metalloregulator ArsR/SmtB family transcription factor [Devosia sp. RR2S18]WIJ23412.1 metalloregulator ArsR/SmtB family transcription factor [Devosia sp. RR2S18]
MVSFDLDATFTSLADPTRRAMLLALKGGEKSIAELAQPHAMTRAGAAKHLAMLEKAQLIERHKVGRKQMCRLRPEPLRHAGGWLHQWEAFWNEQLDSLEAALQEDASGQD